MEIEIGGIYQHFKGKHSLVLGLGTYSQTNEEVVIYKGLESKEIYVRPVKDFCEEVENREDNVMKQKHRFEKI